MRSYSLLAALAGLAVASPMPQDLDWDAIADLDPVPTADVPVVSAAAQTTVLSYNPSAAASAVSSAVMADPTDTSLKARDDSACGANAPSTSDTVATFQANTAYPNAALNAATPSGYNLIYQNTNASSNAVYGYMGFTVLSSYDAGLCASKCNKITGCSSINIYYERDPVVAPTSSCSNPASNVVVKCVFYGGPITAASATNQGQYRDDFHVVIAGSNAYVNQSIATPAGYQAPVPLGTAAINAPDDCNGANTYMGVKIFTSGPFDINQCAAACSAQTAYNLQYPPKTGLPMTCQFFNTYVLYNNSIPVGQYCSLYNETWAPSYATNKGQYRGSDKFTINYSFTVSNTTGGADKATCASK